MKHTNKLISESSPYLLQHAHNPVQWYPWGDEAFEKAKQEDKPVLVSIGYAACHWCHVMERESFENQSVAALMNEHFINIKIDREERPDLDQIYMDAVQLINGQGGWPLNVFLTPEKLPFYGGTYFPPEPAYGRNSWPQVLTALSASWLEKRDEIEEQATALAEHIKSDTWLFDALSKKEDTITKEFLIEVGNKLLSIVDLRYGGFGSAPKFPQSMSLRLMFALSYFLQDDKYAANALFTLRKMATGGIFDQVRGGFYRYSTDAQWLVPHFEKMLYDNALMLLTLADAYRYSGEEIFLQKAMATFNFLETELKSDEGFYYASLDADSEGVEGKFYTFEWADVKNVFSDRADLALNYFGITEAGNWEETNILTTALSEERFITEHELAEEKFHALRHKWIAELKALQDTRVRPATDTKMILSWNALLLQGYTALSTVADLPIVNAAARALADRLASHVSHDRFSRVMNSHKQLAPLLEDLASVIAAFTGYYEVTADRQFISISKQLYDNVVFNFADDDGLFFSASVSASDVAIRKKEMYDGATPSGNAMMAVNQVKLGRISGDETLVRKGIDALQKMKPLIEKHPSSFGYWALGLVNEVWKPVEISADKPGTLTNLRRGYIPGLTFEYKAMDGAIMLCSNEICHPPLKETDQIYGMIKKLRFV